MLTEHGGSTDTERACTGSWHWERNLLPHWGLKPVSVLRLALQSDVLPNELFLPLSGTLILSQGPINCYANEKEKKWATSNLYLTSSTILLMRALSSGWGIISGASQGTSMLNRLLICHFFARLEMKHAVTVHTKLLAAEGVRGDREGLTVLVLRTHCLENTLTRCLPLLVHTNTSKVK